MAGLALGPGVHSLDFGVEARVVAGATGTGTANSSTFAIPVRPGGNDCSLTLSAVETGAFTALTVDLQRSDDGGQTFVAYKAGLNVHTGPQTVTPCPPGVYRLNIASFTGGTSVDVTAIQH